MTSWLIKFRISAALDASAPSSARFRRKIANSAEARDFESETTALGRALKKPSPAAPMPPTLHSSIMKAVRASGRPDPARPRQAALHWLPAPALAASVLLGVWWTINRSGTLSPPNGGSQPTLAAAPTVVEAGDQMTRALPSAVIAPMTDELDRMSRDLDSTAQFLLASVP